MSRIETLAEGVTLYLGDCREILPTLPKVDAVVTDPPYGNNTEYGIFQDTKENVADVIKCLFDWIPYNTERALITCGNSNQHLYPTPKWSLAWITPAGAGCGPWGFNCWQPILAYGSCPYLAAGKGGRPDIIIHTETSEINGHPCPKPIRFMLKLIDRASLMGQIILDPFMGSGTTGVAAVKLGRKFIGIEIEPKYFDIACRRISEALKQPDMFIEQPKQVQAKLELDEPCKRV